MKLEPPAHFSFNPGRSVLRFYLRPLWYLRSCKPVLLISVLLILGGFCLKWSAPFCWTRSSSLPLCLVALVAVANTHVIEKGLSQCPLLNTNTWQMTPISRTTNNNLSAPATKNAMSLLFLIQTYYIVFFKSFIWSPKVNMQSHQSVEADRIQRYPEHKLAAPNLLAFDVAFQII